MEKRVSKLKGKKSRIIVGIETGNMPGRFAAAVVEVNGNGDGTVLDILHFKSHALPKELGGALTALDKNSEEFDSEEFAGLNFLILHHLSTLYRELLDEVDGEPEDVDLIGLKGMEIGGRVLPIDPSALSEMTGCIVASRFGIGSAGDGEGVLPVKESLLQGLVNAMMDRYGLESEVREAVAVALLANESIFHEKSEACKSLNGIGGGGKASLRAVKFTGGDGQAVLCGEFFFPSP